MRPELHAHCASDGWWGLYYVERGQRVYQLAECGRAEEEDVACVALAATVLRHLPLSELQELAARADRGERLSLELLDQSLGREYAEQREHLEDERASVEGARMACRMFLRSGQRRHEQGIALTLSGTVVWAFWFVALYWLLAQRMYTGVP